MIRVAVDTGGTFTDICLLNEETKEVFVTKVSSTPRDPAQAVLSGIARAAGLAGVNLADMCLLLHGTTVATNALLENKGAKAALLTTFGFRDVLLIGRQNRPHLYNFWVTRPAPLIPRRLIFEIKERILASGEVYVPLDEDEICQLVRKLKDMGIGSIAVSLLHAYINPSHERKVKEIIEKIYPGALVTLSSDILPEFREFERTATTVINATVQPLLTAYMNRLERGAKQLVNGLNSGGGRPGLFIMQSNGGVITARQARKEAVRTVLSGPAGGVMAGVELASKTGRQNLITFDMGGTSTDVSLIQKGQPRFTNEGSVGGYPLRLPMLDIHTIGAGGGSIAWIDSGRALRVGPASAGAEPGPVCYGQGGIEPTVTDANLVLGRINPGAVLGEGKKLHIELARHYLEEKIARPLNLTLEKAAEGIITVVNAAMARAIRLISVQRGYDPREFTLVAFGGAGPLHAAELARELNIPQVLIPPYPGATSALGMLTANVRRDYVYTLLLPLEEVSPEQLNLIYGELEENGRRELVGEGFDVKDVFFIRRADLRYSGQSYELTLSIPCGPLTASDLLLTERSFHLIHEREYGSRYQQPVEVVALRVAALGKMPGIKWGAGFKETKEVPGKGKRVPSSCPVKEKRPVFFNSQFLDTPIYDREYIQAGWYIEGPAVIEQADTTVLIWPGMTARSDSWGNLLIESHLQRGFAGKD